MKNLLFFILGFVSVFFTTIAFSAESYPGGCSYLLYQALTAPATYTVPSSSIADTVSVSSSGIVSTSGYPSRPAGTPYVMFSLRVKYWDRDMLAWREPSSISSAKLLESPTFPANSLNMSSATFTSTYSGCSITCPDTDSDGLCDVCDDAPDDSTIGPDTYLKGYYELDGEIVATLVSSSSSSSSYDRILLNKSRQHTNFDGLCIGSCAPIDEQSFIDGGGKFTALIDPKKIYSLSCSTVESGNTCADTICQMDDAPGRPDESLDKEDAEPIILEPDTKQQLAPYLNDQDCSGRRSQCATACKSAFGVKSFTCSDDGKNSSCICDSGGQWNLYNDYSSSQTSIVNTSIDTDINTVIGDGDTASGGGAVTDAGSTSDTNSDGNPNNDQYNYIEGSLDFNRWGQAVSNLKSKFPFSLGSTFSSYYQSFNSSSSPAPFTYSIAGHTVSFDLSAWNNIAQMIRSMFAFGLAISTIGLTIYAFTSMDIWRTR